MRRTKTASTVALELHDWWRRQRRWKTKVEAANSMGMPVTTFKGYFSGSAPTPENRRRLYAATGLDIFADQHASTMTPPSPVVVEAESKLSEVSQTLRVLSEQFASLHEVFEQLKTRDEPARVVSLPQRANAADRAEEAVALIYELIALLDGFRGAKEDRDALRRRIHGPDVGYLASLATALLDEERFESWSAVSSYRPLGIRR